MKLALFEFHAPVRALAQCAAVAALVSALACAAGLRSEYVPWLACAAAWTIGSSWNRLLIPAPGEVERSWPIAERPALWIRVLAAWSFCWVPALASLAAANVLYMLDAVAREHWQTTLGQAACLICVTPIFSAVFHSVDSRRLAIGAFIGLTSLLVAIVTAAAQLAHSSGVFPPWPFDIAALLLAFGIVYFTTLGVRWNDVLFEELLAAPISEPARPYPFRGVTGPLPDTRRVTRWTPLLFFYHSGGMGASAWPALGFMALFVSLGSPNVVWCMIGSQLLLNAYWASPQLAGSFLYLPISRDRVFAWTFVPLCVLLMLVISVEALAGNHHPAKVMYRHYREAARSGVVDRVDDAHRSLQTSPLHWRATLGEAPLARTPSGELQPITSYPVISRSPLRVYNPFDVFQWDEPEAFAEHASQLLLEQDGLTVTSEQARLSDPDVRGTLAKDFGCLKGTLQATCRWPWGWLVMKFAVLALCIWILASAALQARHRGRRQRLRRVALLFVCWGAVFGLSQALDSVSDHAPGNSPVSFGIAVVVGELVRLLESRPLLVGGSGALLLAALYGNLLRRYRSAELWSGTS